MHSSLMYKDPAREVTKTTAQFVAERAIELQQEIEAQPLFPSDLSAVFETASDAELELLETARQAGDGGNCINVIDLMVSNWAEAEGQRLARLEQGQHERQTGDAIVEQGGWL